MNTKLDLLVGHITVPILRHFLTKINHLSTMTPISDMRRSRITITLSTNILKNIDTFADGQKIRNRSHAIEFVLNDYFKPAVKTAVILAGGKGTDLRPFTYELPKALLPIKGKPLLEYTLENCKQNNIRNIIICTGYLGEKIKEYFGDGKRFGVRISYSHEKKPLKTGGALMKIRNLLSNEPFLVMNGDILTNLSFQDIIAFHAQERSLITMTLASVHKPEAFGQLKLHGTKLVEFYQKKKTDKKNVSKAIKSHLINAGIYIFDPAFFSFVPKKEDSFFLEDSIEKLVAQKKVSGFVFDEQWFDVGDAKGYERAIKEFKPI